MSYYYRDVDGFVGDAASVAGWAALAPHLEATGGLLSDFVAEGVSREPELLVDAIRAFLARPAVVLPVDVEQAAQQMLKCALKSRYIFILTDGTDDRPEGNEIVVADFGINEEDFSRPVKDIEEDLRLARLGLSGVRGARRTGYKEEIAALEKELEEAKAGRWVTLRGGRKVLIKGKKKDFIISNEYQQVAQALDALEASAREQFLAVMDGMRKALAKNIKRGHYSPRVILKGGKLPFIKEFNVALSEMMRAAHSLGGSDARSEVKNQFTLLAHEIKNPVLREFADSFTPKAAMKWLKDKQLFVAGVFSDTLMGGIKNLLVNALKAGTPAGTVIESLYKLFDPYLGKPEVLKDGVPPEPHRLNTMIRTVTTEAYNHGRLTEYKDPELAPFILGVRYSAVLDDATTQVCRYLDGKVFKADDPGLPSLIPPNHFNCRSILVPVVVGEKVAAYITAAQVAKAKKLADTKFLTQECAHEV